jgi:large repetitive protein
MSYTIFSRGIGTNFSIPIYDMPYNGSVSSNGLSVREAAYYKVVVPPNTWNWKLKLTSTVGESLMIIQKDFLPCVSPSSTSPAQLYGGRRLQKTGNEHFLQLPVAGQSFIPGGTYYILVASEGQNPNPPYAYAGSNSCSFTLTSFASLVYSNLGTIGPVETARTNSLEAGEIKVYQFNVAAALSALEVRLTDKIGNAYLRLAQNSNAPSGQYSYGYDYGENPLWYHPNLITIPNPSAGFYSLTVQADPATDASFAVRVRQLLPADLAFDRTLSTPGVTNVATGTLADQQHTYFKVTVPPSFNGQPVVGWKLTLDHTQGNPRLRVRKDTFPDEAGYVGNMPYNTDQAVIVPPYLTAGTWYVDVQGQGSSQFTLTSSALLTER